MLWNVLSAASNASSGEGSGGNPWSTWIMIGFLVIILVVFMVYNRRSQKKRQEETINILNAIKPGNKVKTIGYICGVVVEVCDDNTFVLETGTEKSGKSYMKFDKQAVYQTDAVAPTATPAKPVEEAKEATKEETPVVEEVNEVKEEVKEEAPRTEATEEVKEEAPAKKTTRKKKAE